MITHKMKFQENGDIMRVAIFDFDGTLYKEETFQLMMDHFKHHPIYKDRYSAFFRKLLPRYLGYKLKLYPEARMKERSMQLYIAGLGALTPEEMQTYFQEIADKARPDFNKQVVERLQEHHTDGVYTLLVSGAYTPLLKITTEHLPFDATIGTDIPFKDNIVDYNRKIHHIQGERKNKQIHTVLKNKHIDWENSFAYGDSFSDLPVLELVGNPVAVRPDEQLETIAKDRKWTILQ